MADKLQSALPWTAKPLVCSAPMRGFAGPELASEVSKAGGLGFIGCPATASELSAQLHDISNRVSGLRGAGDQLPVGIGVLNFAIDRSEILPVLAKYKPAVVWLFAPNDLDNYVAWAKEIRRNCPSNIWVQTGSVKEAVTIARSCKPDVIIIQGQDAGGHGLERSAGIISVLPEAADTLEKEGFGAIPLLAAGGIVDGRGFAAALALGANGAVMGTRFLASKEAMLPSRVYVDAILNASDGGQATVRSKIFDDMNAKGNIWPVLYDGRALTNLTYRDHLDGMKIEENRRLHSEAVARQDGGWVAGDRRVTIWAGTGIGLVNDVKAAQQIVEETRNGAQKLVKALQARF